MVKCYKGGATRSELHGRRDLIPKEAIDAIARRLELGALRHGENNWRHGGEEFRRVTINHLFKHLSDYIEHGNQSDANTDAIICNAAFLCEYEARGRYGGNADRDPAPPVKRTTGRR
jgi:hypothetical protein